MFSSYKVQESLQNEDFPTSIDDASPDYADELRLLRHPIQLRFAANRHQPDFQFLTCRPRPTTYSEYGRSDYRLARSAPYRCHERPHLDSRLGTPPPVFLNRSHRLQPLPLHLSARYRIVGCRIAAVALGYQQQHRHGTLPRLHRRYRPRTPTIHRLFDAVRVYRLGHYPCQRIALHLPTNRLAATNL